MWMESISCTDACLEEIEVQLGWGRRYIYLKMDEREFVNPAVPWRSIIKANCLRRTYGEVTLV